VDIPKFKYNEKLICELIFYNRRKFGYITKYTALVIWQMCQKIIQRGVYLYKKNEYKHKTKSIFTEDDIKIDLYESVFCNVLIKFDKNKGTFRYLLNKSINYRILRLKELNRVKNNISVKLNGQDETKGNESILNEDYRVLSGTDFNRDLIIFGLKNYGFTDNEINVINDIIDGYKTSKEDNINDDICIRNNISYFEYQQIKKKFKKIIHNLI